jgi:hypothetical protein
VSVTQRSVEFEYLLCWRLGIRKMKLTLIEFAGRWTCLFHIDFQLADLSSSTGTVNFIRD